jgi:hypothetical protein
MKVGFGVFDFETDISCNIVTTKAVSAASNDGSNMSTFTPTLVGQYLNHQWFEEVESTTSLFRDQTNNLLLLKSAAPYFTKSVSVLSTFFSLKNSDFRGLDAYHLLRAYALSKFVDEMNYLLMINQDAVKKLNFLAPVYRDYDSNHLLFQKWIDSVQEYLLFLVSRGDRNGVGACMYDYSEAVGFARPRVIWLIN